MAFTLALWVTPRVSVSVVGQTVDVGAVPPAPPFALSGPGEADLFGEGPVPTVVHFSGPVRPLIVWQRFNRNDAAATFLQSVGGSGSDGAAAAVGERLAAGWGRYFLRLVVVTALLAAGLYLMGVGLGELVGRRVLPHRRRRRHHLGMLSAVVVSSLVLAFGCTALTVTTAQHHLATVSTLADLVGTAPMAPLPKGTSVPKAGVAGVVIGDSTAAGVGNAPVVNATAEDSACGRSSDAYAVVLQSALDRRVLNLACSSATVDQGLLGAQRAGGTTVPPQVGVLRSMPAVSFVIVSIGANDIGWSEFLGYCAVMRRCDDAASDRLFRSRLDAFRIQYAQLLQQLSDLPGRPRIIVNTYYDPFDSNTPCPQIVAAGRASSTDLAQEVAQRIDPLRARLETLNDVLSEGAAAFGFAVAHPRFDGHGICAEQPWVQGLSEPAPFHPRAAGELAIAAADLPFLPSFAGSAP